MVCLCYLLFCLFCVVSAAAASDGNRGDGVDGGVGEEVGGDGAVEIAELALRSPVPSRWLQVLPSRGELKNCKVSYWFVERKQPSLFSLLFLIIQIFILC